MDAPTHPSDSHLKRLLTNNAQRLQTDLKGLWNSAPRSAHPAGTYERGVNYPRLFRLDSSYGLSVKELPGRQGLKPASDFRLTTKATNAVPVKGFSDRQSSISLPNLVDSAHRVRSCADSFSIQQPVESSHDTTRLTFRQLREILRTPSRGMDRYRRLRTTPIMIEYPLLIEGWSQEGSRLLADGV
jgi:hypothetical protein